jgi:sodium-coupled neutral amino acid transporter 9
LYFIIIVFYLSLSIWNTMMGTSLLSVPWALSQSGLGTGLAIAFGMSLVAAYTASIILKTHAKESKFD